jgi:hypothetical protein
MTIVPTLDEAADRADEKFLRNAGAWFSGDPIPADRRLAARLKRAAELIERARQLDLPPKPQALTRVRGGRLSKPVYWTGKQWAVTAYGVECRNGLYCIERHRLWENEYRHGWLLHMAPKPWVDIADFAEALRLARKHHAPYLPAKAGNPATVPST